MEKSMSAEKTVTIPEAEYIRLQRSELWLTCLEGAGVDNWQGYDYAMEDFQKQQATSGLWTPEELDDRF